MLTLVCFNIVDPCFMDQNLFQQRHWQITAVITCSTVAVALPPHLSFQQRHWQRTAIITCSTVAEALPPHLSFQQRHWQRAATPVCLCIAPISTILGVMQRIVIPVQQIIGFIELPQMVPSTAIPNTDGLLMRAAFHQDGHSLN